MSEALVGLAPFAGVLLALLLISSHNAAVAQGQAAAGAAWDEEYLATDSLEEFELLFQARLAEEQAEYERYDREQRARRERRDHDVEEHPERVREGP